MSTFRLLLTCLLLCCFLVPFSVSALDPKEPKTDLDRKEFFKPELNFSVSNVRLENVGSQLTNLTSWNDFNANNKAQSFIDPRSGAPTGIIMHVPLLPGKGTGNQLSLQSIEQQLGRRVTAIDKAIVADLVLSWVKNNQAVLKIDPAEILETKAAQDVEHLWQIQILRQFHGIPVRHSRFIATINHGNLILAGVQNWGAINLSPQTNFDAESAMRIGFEYAGGKLEQDFIFKQPALEVIPVAADSQELGRGYGHRLAWVFGFQRRPDRATWEVIVDAHSGELLAFKDINHYAKKKIHGGVYPLTNTEVCAVPKQCGTMQPAYPMPFADTGLAAPNDFTNSAGVFDWASGPTTTTLSGRYVNIFDNCGPVAESSTTGDINLGGTNGEHNCESAGSSPGDTAASRSGFYELNKLIELAKGWLPGNAWLQAQITANMNIESVCNAFYSPVDGTINFYQSGSSGTTNCANTGEIAAVFDHEWGHALDDNDTVGALSVTSEGYADAVGILRLQASCVGHGFFQAPAGACGLAADGTRNVDEDQTAGTHCAVDCSGVRDTDWALHVDNTPDTPLNFVCTKCASPDTGPCGRQVHCSGAPIRQAAWDFAARDLQMAPFNYDSGTAFIIANKIFYQGSGNIGLWYTCDCALSQSNGCNADSGYLQWLAADDDNGILLDGTPHMTAIFNAYNRHGIACSTPTPVNSGCPGAPTAAPNLTVTSGDFKFTLNWNSVAGATKYWVFRTEGFAGCDFGKALIAEVTGTSYVDNEVANGRPYSYSVMAVGASNACFGPASNCQTISAQDCAATMFVNKNEYDCDDTVEITVHDDRVGAGTITVRVSSKRESTPETVTLTETPANSGIFTGSIQTSMAPKVAGDGKISVNNADLLRVRYVEPNRCGQLNKVLEVTAFVDCSTCEGSTATGKNLEVLPEPTNLTMTTGDGDQFFDNCESADFTFTVRNNGRGPLRNVKIQQITASDPGIQITTTLPKLIASRLNQCQTAQGSFSFTGSDLSPGDTIEFNVTIYADGLTTINRSGLFRVGPVEKDLQAVTTDTFSFETDFEGWLNTTGSFTRQPTGASGTTFHIASSSAVADACDRIESPVIQLTNSSTMRMFTRFDTEPCSTECYDRANVGVLEVETGARTTVDPDGGILYNASGANGTCVTQLQNGWAGAQPAFLQSDWSSNALQASSFVGKNIKLDVAYGTDPLITGTGFRFDEVTITNFLRLVDDGQSNSCP